MKSKEDKNQAVITFLLAMKELKNKIKTNKDTPPVLSPQAIPPKCVQKMIAEYIMSRNLKEVAEDLQSVTYFGSGKDGDIAAEIFLMGVMKLILAIEAATANNSWERERMYTDLIWNGDEYSSSLRSKINYLCQDRKKDTKTGKMFAIVKEALENISQFSNCELIIEGQKTRSERLAELFIEMNKYIEDYKPRTPQKRIKELKEFIDYAYKEELGIFDFSDKKALNEVRTLLTNFSQDEDIEALKSGLNKLSAYSNVAKFIQQNLSAALTDGINLDNKWKTEKEKQKTTSKPFSFWPSFSSDSDFDDVNPNPKKGGPSM
ncbi:hypothetical protein Lgra_1947 [Legionella gratiana]|uniref:Uncharacterized protein n=1 Tax=Legionella gratiana TaxID=45066 RepID=A0A378JBF8_9GAMM|nr:hypothetical protein [Legionella gratiana]KTD10981.1 hypothetical protein Lgra_1947 [Legionella gratiana]STX44676.1 Uncharacterised protein [Legionella gratiana]